MRPKPTPPPPSTGSPACQARRVPLSAEAMQTLGFITETERDRLEAYVKAADELEAAFGAGPGEVESRAKDWERAGAEIEDAKRRVEQAQRRKAEAREGVIRSAREQARAVGELVSGAMAVLLEREPERLAGVRDLVSALGRAADERADPQELAEGARRLSEACLQVRSTVRAGG